MTMKTEQKVEESVSPAIEKTAKKSIQKQVAKDKLQPFPEQLRIAQLLDNAKKEDPKLKEKLKHVVEATQKSMDEAYIALHDSDYDLNRAVNMLLEGTEMQWSTLAKKKRTKTPAPKQEKEKKGDSPKHSMVEENSEPVIGNKPFGSRGGGHFRGRGRGGYHGGRSSNNIQEHPKVFTNISLDNETPQVIETRYFERASSSRGPVVRPEDTWDPNHPLSNLLNRIARGDLDEEEYTGSLSKSLVITSSSFGKGSSPTEQVCTTEIINKWKDDLELNDTLPNDVPISPLIKSSENSQEAPTPAPPVQFPVNDSISKQSFGSRAPPMSASVFKSLPRVEKLPSMTKLLQCDKITEPSSKASSNSISIEKPTSASRIPTTAVEMPPGSDNGIRLLDVTFGAIDLTEKLDESFPTDTQPPPSVPNLPLPVQKKATITDTTPFKVDPVVPTKESPVETNHPEPVREVATTKLETSSFYETNLSQSTYSKPAPKPRNTYSTGFSSDSLNPSNSILYPTSMPPTTYSSPPGIQGVGSNSCPPLHYNTFNSQATQQLPLMQNMSNHYQNVLGAQTYTSNSQYGALPSSSYSVPYQSYSSMLQSQKQPSTCPFTKELEASTTGNLNALSYGGVTNAAMSLPTVSGIPSTKSSNLQSTIGKSNVLSNMPPVVGPHQIILGQGGMPYFQQPLYHYQDVHMLQQQQRLTSHLNSGYYDINYSGSSARDGTYHINDKMFLRPDGSLIQHTNHLTGGATNDPGSNMVYGDNFSGHYAGLCVSGNDSGCGRTDNFKSSIQTPMNQGMLSSVKPVTSSSKVNSYE